MMRSTCVAGLATQVEQYARSHGGQYSSAGPHQARESEHHPAAASPRSRDSGKSYCSSNPPPVDQEAAPGPRGPMATPASTH